MYAGSRRFELRDHGIVPITTDYLIMNSVYVHLMLG
jgi:hypothetical protein